LFIRPSSGHAWLGRINKKKPLRLRRQGLRSGRGERIRTSDFYVPNVALYRAEPHPECSAPAYRQVGGKDKTEERGRKRSGVELVADALDGLDPIVTDLFAQLADVHIDRAITYEEFVAPDLIVDLFPLEDLAGLAHKKDQ
jgi:hypothetical protein